VFILLFILLNYAGLVLEKIGTFICSIGFVEHMEVG